MQATTPGRAGSDGAVCPENSNSGEMASADTKKSNAKAKAPKPIERTQSKSGSSTFTNLRQVSSARDLNKLSARSFSRSISRASVRRRTAYLVRFLDFIGHLGVKARIIISFAQVISQIDVVFNIKYPDFYREMLRALSQLNISLGLLPTACILPWTDGYIFELIFKTLVPSLIVAFLIVTSKWLRRNSKRARMRGKKSDGEFFADVCADLWFILLFLMYPSTCATIFKFFSYTYFNGPGEDGRQVLRADPSVDVSSTEYRLAMIYVVPMFVLFPIGVPVYYALTLFRSRNALHKIRQLELQNQAFFTAAKTQAENLAPERRAAFAMQTQVTYLASRGQYDKLRRELPSTLRKLTAGYEMRCYWFEIFECIRKILLVGLPVFFEPGTPGQLILGLVIAFVTFGSYCAFAPYINSTDDLLSAICQLTIFFSLVASIVTKEFPNDHAMSVLLPVLLLLPIVLTFLSEIEFFSFCHSYLSRDDQKESSVSQRLNACRKGFISWLDRVLGTERMHNKFLNRLQGTGNVHNISSSSGHHHRVSADGIDDGETSSRSPALSPGSARRRIALLRIWNTAQVVPTSPDQVARSSSTEQPVAERKEHEVRELEEVATDESAVSASALGITSGLIRHQTSSDSETSSPHDTSLLHEDAPKSGISPDYTPSTLETMGLDDFTSPRTSAGDLENLEEGDSSHHTGQRTLRLMRIAALQTKLATCQAVRERAVGNTSMTSAKLLLSPLADASVGAPIPTSPAAQQDQASASANPLSEALRSEMLDGISDLEENASDLTDGLLDSEGGSSGPRLTRVPSRRRTAQPRAVRLEL